MITNNSGRYGLVEGRTSTHLVNVAKKFKSYGIPVNPKFTPPEPDYA